MPKRSQTEELIERTSQNWRS